MCDNTCIMFTYFLATNNLRTNARSTGIRQAGVAGMNVR